MQSPVGSDFVTTAVPLICILVQAVWSLVLLGVSVGTITKDIVFVAVAACKMKLMTSKFSTFYY